MISFYFADLTSIIGQKSQLPTPPVTMKPALIKMDNHCRMLSILLPKKKAVLPIPGNPAFRARSGNPAIRLQRTRGFPSPDYSGFGFFMRDLNFKLYLSFRP